MRGSTKFNNVTRLVPGINQFMPVVQSLVLTAIALVLASTAFAESADDLLRAIESRIAAIESRVKAGKVSELQRTRKLHNAVLFDIRLETEMRRATELVVISGRGFSDGGRSFFVLGVAKPSEKNPGGGFAAPGRKTPCC